MNLFLYFLTVVIWGTTWIAIKLQLGVVAIPVSIFYRFALAGLVLFAALLLTRKLQRLDRRGHALCLGQGLCLFCLNFLCFYTATQWIPSGLVSVVFSAATLWNALNARLWFGTRIAPRVMVAGVIGFTGLVLLFWPELAGQEASRETLLGLGFALLGTFCFSTGNMLSSLQQRAGIRPLTGNAYSMLYGAAVLLAGCLAAGVPFRFDTSAAYVGALLYLAIPGVGDRLHRLPDAGGTHGPGARRLLHRVVPGGGAERVDLRRGLPVDARRPARAGAGDVRQPAGLHQVVAVLAPRGGLIDMGARRKCARRPGATTRAASRAGGRSPRRGSGS